jgi:Flp pilus assembly protein TadD
MEIQEIYRQAQGESDQNRKMKLYATLVERAPWHPFGVKSLAVCHYMAGNRKKAHELLKRAAELAPLDENILANLRRVESEM